MTGCTLTIVAITPPPPLPPPPPDPLRAFHVILLTVKQGGELYDFLSTAEKKYHSPIDAGVAGAELALRHVRERMEL